MSVIPEDNILKLRLLGFTEYESRVFLAVLKGNLLSASEIADDAGIRRTDVYNILKSFVDKGFVNEIETNSVLKYEMIEPDIIFDKLEKDVIKSREKEIRNLNDTLTSLKPLYKTKESEKSKVVNVELIRGYNQHREAKFIDLLKSAKKEILFMVRLEHYVSDEIDETAKSFFKNGGIIKSVYETSLNFKVKRGNNWNEGTLEDLIKTVEKFEKYGEKIRLSEIPVPNITVFDGETVFININDKSVPKHNEADIIIRSKEFAQNMTFVFDQYWNNSHTIKEFKKNKLKESLHKEVKLN